MTYFVVLWGWSIIYQPQDIISPRIYDLLQCAHYNHYFQFLFFVPISTVLWYQRVLCNFFFSFSLVSYLSLSWKDAGLKKKKGGGGQTATKLFVTFYHFSLDFYVVLCRGTWKCFSNAINQWEIYLHCFFFFVIN